MPTPPVQQVFELAVQHHQAGRLQEAEHAYRQILAQQPGHVNSVHLLGVVSYQSGRHADAVDLIRHALRLRPNWPDAYFNLAKALKDSGDLKKAVVAYRQAIALNPNDAEAHFGIGCALHEQEEYDAAAAAYRQAIAIRSNYPEAFNNLGNALKKQGKLNESIAAFREAIALDPKYAQAFHNLGNGLKEVQQFDAAILAFGRSIELNPDSSETFSNLGLVLRDRGQCDEAVAAIRHAIALKPNSAEAYTNLGNILHTMGALDEAIAAFRKALELNPNLTQAHSNLVNGMHYHPDFDAWAIAKEQRQWNQQHAQPLRRCAGPHLNDRNPDRRVRIGYVSADFRDHVVGRNVVPLLANHDESQFEIFAYSSARVPDARTVQFRGYTDHWRSIVGLPDEQVADQIRSDGIDILVDLALHTSGSRLLIFARKPAPVQATFAGYPGGTGLSAIDYRLSDPYLDPTGMDESVYTERTIRLPDAFWCYDPLETGGTPVNSLPCLESGTITFGCLNSFCKINQRVLALWAQVLRNVQNSRLLLLADPGQHRRRALDQLSGEGIDSGRVQFAPRQSRKGYLELYHGIDLGLDSFPYNGHTTSLDSFWMGVPVVTLVGQTAVSRAGWCQLSNLRLTELAAHSPEQFVQIAVELANDPPRLQEMRSTLRQRMENSPLMDARGFARNIEAAYRQMWRDWCAKTEASL